MASRRLREHVAEAEELGLLSDLDAEARPASLVRGSPAVPGEPAACGSKNTACSDGNRDFVKQGARQRREVTDRVCVRVPLATVRLCRALRLCRPVPCVMRTSSRPPRYPP